MGKISILPDNLCNQIAAGEVVERPAAVVKELVENSIDARSRKISVILLQGGRKEIRVVDNGVGMSSDDALLALERHATSKIKTLEDLQSVESLGFRGEALPSIAAVSRFELLTKESEALSGVCIRVDGGILKDVREAGCPSGTMITVRDLFHNIPARRKFLRSVDTEMAHISDQFLRLSMAHPEIHFQLSHQGRLQYDFPSADNILDRAGQVFGTELAGKLMPFSMEAPRVNLHGLAGQPELQRANSRFLFIYVNGRPVWDRLLNRTVLSAYDTLMPKGRFPLVVLYLGLPPAEVDVNVHPTKREIRLRSPGDVLEAVRSTVRQTMERSGPQGGPGSFHHRMTARDGRFRFPVPGARESQVSIEDAFRGSPFQRASSPPAQLAAFPNALDCPEIHATDGADAEKAAGDGPSFSRLSVLGQLANTYILLESPDGLVLIDQHAAHERILFDRLSSSSPGEAGSQRLAQSLVLNLFPREAAMLRRHLEHLSRIGFEIEPFGGDSFMIHAVPTVLNFPAPDVIIREMLEAALEEEKSPRWDLLSSLAKTASCHSALRAGQKLQPEEIRSLLEQLDRTRAPVTCPHGRPLACKLTHSEIARLFKRT